jgi:hypothetical protein
VEKKDYQEGDQGTDEGGKGTTAGDTFNLGSFAAALSNPFKWTNSPCKAISCFISKKGLIRLKGE